MKKFYLLFVLLQIISSAFAQSQETCNFFLIKEENNDIAIEKVLLNKDEVRVFRDKNLISYILVFDPGSKSGDLMKKDQRLDGIIARFADGKILTSIIKQDGTKKKMPDIDIKKAKNIDIRFSITGANGYEKAYLIEKYNTIKTDNGPVLDVFGGSIKLEKGDFSMLTECTESMGTVVIEGSVPYEIYNGWITIFCTLPNGKSGRFVVDFGATTTVIEQKFLQRDAIIQKYQIVEYSSDGIKRSNAIIPGATGSVDNIEGTTILSELILGDIKLNDFKATVVKSFPEIFHDYEIMGILGRDLLMKTEKIDIRNLNESNAQQNIIFSSNFNKEAECDYILPLKIAGGHLFIDGHIQNVPITFLFDSGSGKSNIDKKFLENNNISYNIMSGTKTTLTGLDGKGIDHELIKLKRVNLNKIDIDEMEFYIGDTFILKHMGFKDDTALLGMNFLKHFKNVCFDFSSNNILLWE